MAKLVRSKRPDNFENEKGAKAPSNYRADEVVESKDIVLPPSASRPEKGVISESKVIPKSEFISTLPASYQKSNVKPVIKEEKKKEYSYKIPEGYTGPIPTLKEVKSDFVSELEVRLDDTGARSWKEIDSIMRGICKKHNISPTKLHKDFKKKHGMIPDEWVKRNDPKEEIKEDLRTPMEKLADQIASTAPKEPAITEVADSEVRLSYMEKTIQDMRKMMLEMAQGTIVSGLGIGSSGSGEVRVNRMDDVSTANLSDGDVLIWDEEMQKWIPGAAIGYQDKITSLEGKILSLMQYVSDHTHSGDGEVDTRVLLELEQSDGSTPTLPEYGESTSFSSGPIPQTSQFNDTVADGDTTRFIVGVDNRGVYTLDGIAQPTVILPRGDIIEFDLSNLEHPEQFDLYSNGEILTYGRARFNDTDILRLRTALVPSSISKVYYKNSITRGLGWVIAITDN